MFILFQSIENTLSICVYIVANGNEFLISHTLTVLSYELDANMFSFSGWYLISDTHNACDLNIFCDFFESL